MNDPYEQKRAQSYRSWSSEDLNIPNDHLLPVGMEKANEAQLSKWDGIRVVNLFSGLAGMVFLVSMIPNLHHLIQHSVLLNLFLFLGVVGFSGVVAYPYALHLKLKGNWQDDSLLSALRYGGQCFLLLLAVILLTMPVTGIALALILCPAPLYLFTRSTTIMEKISPVKENLEDFENIISKDLHKLLWLVLFVILPLLFLIGVRSFMQFLG